MNENEFHISKKQERILFLDFCFLRKENSSKWEKRIMVLSNKGIYFLILPKRPCSVCQAENFCPKGPSLDFRFEYEHANKIIK